MSDPVPAPTILRRHLARHGFHTPRTRRSRLLAVAAIVAFGILLGDR